MADPNDNKFVAPYQNEDEIEPRPHRNNRNRSHRRRNSRSDNPTTATAAAATAAAVTATENANAAIAALNAAITEASKQPHSPNPNTVTAAHAHYAAVTDYSNFVPYDRGIPGKVYQSTGAPDPNDLKLPVMTEILKDPAHFETWCYEPCSMRGRD